MEKFNAIFRYVKGEIVVFSKYGNSVMYQSVADKEYNVNGKWMLSEMSSFTWKGVWYVVIQRENNTVVGIAEGRSYGIVVKKMVFGLVIGVVEYPDRVEHLNCDLQKIANEFY